MKLYIAILDKVPSNMVPVVVAHAVLGAHLAFSSNKEYNKWLAESFRKCVVKVNQKEFDKIVVIEHSYLGYERVTLDGKICCVIPPPTEVVPNVLKFAKLWTP